MTTHARTCANPECAARFIDTSPNHMRQYCARTCKVKMANARLRQKRSDETEAAKRKGSTPELAARLHELLAHQQAGTKPPRAHHARADRSDRGDPHLTMGRFGMHTPWAEDNRQ